MSLTILLRKILSIDQNPLFMHYDYARMIRNRIEIGVGEEKPSRWAGKKEERNVLTTSYSQ